jgi:hypothetical protein
VENAFASSLNQLIAAVASGSDANMIIAGISGIAGQFGMLIY